MTQGKAREDGRITTLSTPVLTGLLIGNAWPVMAAASGETMTVVGEAATKTETLSIETPQSVSRIDRAEMDARGVSTIGDAAEYTPGVFANQVGASNRYDYLVMRGFSDGSLSNTFLDGLKIMGDTNGYSSMVIDPWFLEQVDIVKGPASVLYGRSSPGGLVALTSKKPLFEARNALRVRADNNATRSMAFDFSGPLGD
ncbi:TonB-dependent receptor plug domain-containing protein [Larsenimonas salina]|uniref:TonB-dependent receptor plug domain-containing protein n=1 Tax=Larsenimonas salina TaxID=1295565 RepID=UPI0032ECF721